MSYPNSCHQLAIFPSCASTLLAKIGKKIIFIFISKLGLANRLLQGKAVQERVVALASSALH
jgi:hypothetical protein